MQRVGQFVNLLLAADTHSLALSLNNVAGIEVHLFGFQLQVATEVIIHLLHHTSPLRIARIGLTLMHQDTLDDTILLSLLGQRDQTLIRVVVVGFEHSLHPLRRLLHIALDAIGQKSLDIDTTDGHMDNTNLDVLRQRSHHRTSKPVGRSQTRIGTAQRSRSLAPLTHLPALLREVHCGHQQETRTRALQILSLRTGCTLHVRLAETQEDIEIRVYSRLHLQGRQH